MIAIIGSNGQLGHELVRQAEAEGIAHLALDMPDIDITDPGSIDEKLGAKDISLIINAAAYTAVDKAEDEPELAYAVNSDGPANLAALCRKQAAPLIHVSTDYVFDGEKQGPYVEDDPVSPLGTYGKSKADGENRIRQILDRHVIVRTAWLCGTHGSNFVKTMLRLGKERDTLKVVDDQFGCPTFAADLAGALLRMVERIELGHEHWGTYHYCGEGETSWYGFAESIFEIARQYENFRVERIVPIATEEWPTPVKRPKNSVLDCGKIEDHYGVTIRPWRDSLADMLEKILSPR